MDLAIPPCRLELRLGDVTRQPLDAIVNAANSRLQPGGGVDGAVHRRGGPTILAELRERYPGGCPTGSAVITDGGDLAARFVIHAVGPVWRGGDQGESEQLASAYRAALNLAVDHDCRGVAFPAISTGIYGYPLDRASQVALDTVVDFLRQRHAPELVRFVLFDERSLTVFSENLSRQEHR